MHDALSLTADGLTVVGTLLTLALELRRLRRDLGEEARGGDGTDPKDDVRGTDRDDDVAGAAG
ncbi:hypothetical protein [Streptomyces sp. NPDC093225]|uniref:hypothetical protein n=1 Tax=Streptomyces sp. NPDC093225 TaxID=3366034 RepID=UPI00382075DE